MATSCNSTGKVSGLGCACVSNDELTVLVSWSVDPLNERVCCVAITFKITEQVEQRICIKFCVKLEHFSTETIQMIQEAVALGDSWLAALSWQHICSCIMTHAEFFGQTSNHPGDLAPYSPDLVPCDFCLFLKLKSPLKGKRFQNFNDSQENTVGAADDNWENYVRSQAAYFERDWGITVLCTMFFISCIFFNKCLYFSYYMAGYFMDKPLYMHTI